MSDKDHDPVHSPSHYTGEIECIDAMRAAFTRQEVAAFCKLNAFKYIWRAGKKGLSVEDLEKALVYLGWNIDTEKDIVADPGPQPPDDEKLDIVLTPCVGSHDEAQTDLPHGTSLVPDSLLDGRIIRNPIPDRTVH